MIPNSKDLEFVSQLMEKGTIIPVVDKIFSFEETPEAFAYVEQGHATGKVVVVVSKP